MEYPRCHLRFLHIHIVFKLIVHICKENTGTCDLWVVSCYSNNIIVISLSQYAHCDWSILQAILYCTAC